LRLSSHSKWAWTPCARVGAVPLLVAIMTTRQRITFAEPRLVGSRWEPCLGTGVPVLVAWDAPQFSLDVAGNVVPVRGGGRPLSSVSATQRRNRSPYLVTAPSDQSLSPLSASLCTSHKDGAMPSPRKRRLVPRALLPSPVSVRHTSAMPAAMLAPSTACDHDREDALGVVLKLAEAGVRAANRDGNSSLLAALASSAAQQNTGNMRARLHAGVAALRQLAARREAHELLQAREAREAQHEVREVDNTHSGRRSTGRAATLLVESDIEAVDTEINYADWLWAAETQLWGAACPAWHCSPSRPPA